MCAVGERPAGFGGGKGRQQQQQPPQRPPQQLSDFVPLAPPSRVDTNGGGRSSRRGRDASHLLNFQPLPLPVSEAAAAAPPPRRTPSRPVSTRSKFDQQVQHLRAKYHLLVAPGGDYRAPTLDPNCEMEWSTVRAVRLVTAESIRCPICLLEPPLCPQMYPCSHILCLPCALRLHAASTESESLCKCPLCSEHVQLEDLRSVCLVPVEPIRPSASTSATASASASAASMPSSKRGTRFAKLPLFAPAGGSAAAAAAATVGASSVAPTVDAALSTGPKLLGFTAVRSFESFAVSQLEQIAVARREAEAEALAAAALDHAPAKAAGGSTATAPSDKPRTAADVLRARPAVAESFPTLQPSSASRAASGAHVTDVSNVTEAWMADPARAEEMAFLDAAETLVQSRRAEWAETDGEQQGGEMPTTAPNEEAASPAAGGASPAAADALAAEGVDEGADGGGARLVLQAADGQLVFADALSTRMLIDEFGSWSAVPELTVAPVIELVSHRMSDEGVRKRFKSLSHLPLSSSFQVAELDLSGIVSARVMKSAHEQLTRRVERRRAKLAEERAAEAAAQRDREERARKHGRSALAFELEMMSLDEVDAARRRQELMSTAMLPDVEVAPEWHEQWSQQQAAAAARQQVSFATMALRGFAATGPTLAASASPEHGPSSPSYGPSRSPRNSRSPGASPSVTPSATPSGMWPAVVMPASPPTAELPPLRASAATPAGGTSLLGGGTTSSTSNAIQQQNESVVVGFDVPTSAVDVADDDGSGQPSSSVGSGGKKGRKQKVTLLSNSSGGRSSQ